MTTGSTATTSGNVLSGAEIRKVIFASSLGTVFEWYDFYIYATLGFFVSLVVIGGCRANMSEDAFKSWGWRIPFLISLVLLVISVYIRLKLDESPVFLQMKALGKGSKAPLRDSFTNWANLKIVL